MPSLLSACCHADVTYTPQPICNECGESTTLVKAQSEQACPLYSHRYLLGSGRCSACGARYEDATPSLSGPEPYHPDIAKGRIVEVEPSDSIRADEDFYDATAGEDFTWTPSRGTEER